MVKQRSSRGRRRLPTTGPKGIGPKVWLATNKVWALWCEGYRSPEQEGLLRKVRDRIGHDGLSERTLEKPSPICGKNV